MPWFGFWNGMCLLNQITCHHYFYSEHDCLMQHDQYKNFVQGHCTWRQHTVTRDSSSLTNCQTWPSSEHFENLLIKNSAAVASTQTIHSHDSLAGTYTEVTSDKHSNNVNTQLTLSSVFPAKCRSQCVRLLFLQVVTRIETLCFWYCFGDTSGWWSIWGEV